LRRFPALVPAPCRRRHEEEAGHALPRCKIESQILRSAWIPVSWFLCVCLRGCLMRVPSLCMWLFEFLSDGEVCLRILSSSFFVLFFCFLKKSFPYDFTFLLDRYALGLWYACLCFNKLFVVRSVQTSGHFRILVGWWFGEIRCRSKQFLW